MINRQDKKQTKNLVDSQLGEIGYELSEQELRQINGGNVVWGGAGNPPPPPPKFDEMSQYPKEDDR